jgi:hypothetical protein
MTLSRPTARSIRKLGSTAGFGMALLCIAAVPASAKMASRGAIVNEAPAAISAALAVCPGQTFAQPFMGIGDSNYYTLVQGSEFNAPSEGWELLGSAKLVTGPRPDGSAGSALNLPSGSVAISPPVCVTLQYPTARIWTRGSEGDRNLVVAVAYANTKTMSKPKVLGAITPASNPQSGQQTAWSLSAPFNVQPELGGTVEAARQVRFVFSAGKGHSDTQLYGLFVDPRMR